MIPTRPFHFLRHGQTDWNLEGRYQGHSDIALNATGIGQAQAAAHRLIGAPITLIVSSPLIRALKTAAIVAEALGRPIRIDKDLRERNFGAFDGLVIKDVKRQHGLRPEESSRSILPPDADHWREIHERVPPAIARWLTENPEEQLLFVAHGGVFDALHEHLGEPRTGPESHHAVPYLFEPVAGGWRHTAIERGSGPVAAHE